MADDFLNGREATPSSLQNEVPRMERAVVPQRSQALLCFMSTELSFFLCSLSLYSSHPYWVDCNIVPTPTTQLSVRPHG